MLLGVFAGWGPTLTVFVIPVVIARIGISATCDDQPVLLLVEREDAWWAVVRVDGDDDPRVFVSDIAGAVASPYAELLAVADEEDEDLAPGVCGGDLDLLSDLGTSPESLREMCDEQLLPMDALAAVAEAGGFAEQLDSLR